MTPPQAFYVGYQRRAPAEVGGFLRRLSVGLWLMAAVGGGLLASLQGPFDPGSFEFLEFRPFHGTLVAHPYPTLEVLRPGVTSPALSRYLLVDPGKHGASASLPDLGGAVIQLRGSLIYREGTTMIELEPDTVGAAPAPAAGAPASPAMVTDELGEATLIGEIVDSKCYLGVMKPGRGTVHRACAVRCISGGIPPALAVTTADGSRYFFLLTDPAGGALGREVLPFVGAPVAVRGAVRRQGERLLLAVDLTSVRPLPR